MRPIRLAAALVAGAMAFPLVVAADADPVEPYLTDQAGDANGLNGQGLDSSVPEVAAVGYDMADLLGLNFVTLFDDDGEANALEIRLLTAAPLTTMGDTMLIRMNGDVGGCPGRFQINVDNVVYGDSIDFNWYLDGCTGTSDDAVITGITVADDEWVLALDEETGETVVTIPFASLAEHKLDGYLKAGKRITITDVTVRHVIGEPSGTAPYSVVVPVWDIMHNPDFASYKIGG